MNLRSSKRIARVPVHLSASDPRGGIMLQFTYVRRQIDELFCEHLILVVIDDNITTRRCKDITECSASLEGIMQHHFSVTDASYVAIGIVIITQNSVEASCDTCR